MNPLPYESGIMMAASQTNADVRLAKMQVVIGSPQPSPNDIPSSIIVPNASVNSRNGHTRTISINDAGTALDLERSEISKWRAVAAIATSIRDKAGSQIHFITSMEDSASMAPSRRIHDR